MSRDTNLQPTTKLPAAPDPVTARPDGMSYKEYKELRTQTNRNLKARRKGFLVWLANEILFDNQNRPIGMKYRRGMTFYGKTKFLQPV